jgi:lysophospholipase L1-like esterase
MKNKLIIFIAFFVAQFAVPSLYADNKVLVAGDSWAAFMCVQNSFTQVFNNYGDPSAFAHPGCWLTTKIGNRAENWLHTSQHKRTMSIIAKDEQIRVLVLSIGGNDLINYANKNMPQDQQDALFDYIFKNTSEIINIYKNIRPDIKIIISGYDYPRFTHNHPISAYKKAFNEMGQPEPVELNQILIRFSNYMSALNNYKDIAYIHHLGVMHYFDGNPEAGLGRNQTLHPDLISSPKNPVIFGGLPALHAAKKSMLTVTNKLVDAFHLSQPGYYRLAEHTYRNYLKNWLRSP